MRIAIFPLPISIPYRSYSTVDMAIETAFCYVHISIPYRSYSNQVPSPPPNEDISFQSLIGLILTPMLPSTIPSTADFNPL